MTLSPDELSQRLGEIPSLCPTVLEILDLLDRPNPDYHRLEQALSADPAIAGRVLRLANSAFFGFAGQIGSIREACLVLGNQGLRQIVLAVGAMQQFPVTAHSGLNHRGLWEHSLAVATAAHGLAAQVGLEPGLAGTAGLLHDLGKLALSAHFADLYRDVFHYAAAHDCLIDKAERVVLGFEHALVGHDLAHRWQLPAGLTDAIGRHHCPDNGDPHLLTDVVHVADILTRALGVGDPGDDDIPSLSEAAWGRLGLDWNTVSTLFPRIDTVNVDGLFERGAHHG